VALKSSFGFGPLEDDDFAAALPEGLYFWQSQQFYDAYSYTNQMCDYMEVCDAVPSKSKECKQKANEISPV
jgi:hypothetical protein